MSIVGRIELAIKSKGYSHEKEKDGIIEYTAHYYEMVYEKFDDKMFLVFMAPNDKDATIKAKSNLNTFGGSKIISIRRLDSKALGKSLTWQKKGKKP